VPISVESATPRAAQKSEEEQAMDREEQDEKRRPRRDENDEDRSPPAPWRFDDWAAI
jgi:hypothetical protein